MTALLSSATLLGLGTVSGIYLTGLIHDHRVRDLSAAQYVAMHQMRDKTFRVVMPWIGLGTLALVIAFAMLAAPPGLPRVLALTAVAALLCDIAFTALRQVPLNKSIQRWTEGTIPPDWQGYRDTWARQHNLRIVLSLLVDGCILAALAAGE